LSFVGQSSSSKEFLWTALEFVIEGSNDFWNPIWSEGPYQLGITIVETPIKNYEELDIYTADEGCYGADAGRKLRAVVTNCV
jgi:hypothetical protein